jgi:tether containing UBX domain for GLUT4
MKDGDPGAGRLYYQRPVLQVMGRELSSFVDLQKSLAQLGFNSGSTLLRLSFRTSETPLEEAMEEIQSYFESVDEPGSKPTTAEISTVAAEPAIASQETPKAIPEWTSEEAANPTSSSIETGHASPQTDSTNTTASSDTKRPLSVFLAPSSSTPSAATSIYNPADYTPTVEHAHTHQRMLAQSTRNVRLLNEAEIEAQQEQEREKLANIKEVEVKLRFPDETSVVVKFGQSDTGKSLYDFARECLDTQWVDEKFLLRNPGFRAQKGDEVIPDSDNKKLIGNLGMKGRVLVVFSWDTGEGGSSADARATKTVLKAELRRVAREVEVKEVTVPADAEEDAGVKVDVSKKVQGGDEGKKKGGVPKWFKGLSKG